MTSSLMRGTQTHGKEGTGATRGIATERERGPIDVGAVQVAPLIAPQRVQLCGPSAITAHSARHLTPPAFPCRLLSPSLKLPVLKPTRFCPAPARDISLGRGGGYRVFLFKCTQSTCRRAPVDLNAIRGVDAI